MGLLFLELNYTKKISLQIISYPTRLTSALQQWEAYYRFKKNGPDIFRATNRAFCEVFQGMSMYEKVTI